MMKDGIVKHFDKRSLDDILMKKDVLAKNTF